MAFPLSPGVEFTEKDLTLGVRGVSTSKGGFVGRFNWGPAEERVLVTAEDELAARFAKPDDNNGADWLCAASFLAYANALEVVRVVDGASAKNATSSGTGVLVKNQSAYETAVLTDGNAFIAKYPGALGNNIIISIGTSTNFGTWDYANAFDSAPETTDEIHIAIVDGSGAWTGLAGTILERFPFVSLIEGTKADDGSNIYFKDKINNESKYVWVGGDFNNPGTTLNETVTVAKADYTTEETFVGVTGAAQTINLAYDILPTSKILVVGSVTGTIVPNSIDDVANTIEVDADAGGEDITVTILEEAGFTVALATEEFDADDTMVITFAGFTLVEDTDYTRNAATNTITIDPYGSAGLTAAIDLSTATTDAVFAITVGGEIEYTLTGGANDASSPDKTDGYPLLENAEEVDISLLITGAATVTEAQYALDNVASVRRDVVAFISPELSDVVNVADPATALANVIDFKSNFNSSSYGFMDCNWKYMYDRYNDKFRWVPLNGDIAGLAANTDSVADPWFSFGGYNRGFIRNAAKLAWNPKKAYRDELYKNSVNPVIDERGEGKVLLGDKTMLTRPSAFSRVNVRRLFIVLEKAIANAAKYQLFEFNDEFTRAQFVNLVTPFLRDVQGRRGITDFRVVADETNNTGEVIDRNEFVGDIYIKPAISINYIKLNFIAVRTGVSFDEVLGA